MHPSTAGDRTPVDSHVSIASIRPLSLHLPQPLTRKVSKQASNGGPSPIGDRPVAAPGAAVNQRFSMRRSMAPASPSPSSASFRSARSCTRCGDQPWNNIDPVSCRLGDGPGGLSRAGARANSYHTRNEPKGFCCMEPPQPVCAEGKNGCQPQAGKCVGKLRRWRQVIFRKGKPREPHRGEGAAGASPAGGKILQYRFAPPAHHSSVRR
jgi:hypothetical protein